MGKKNVFWVINAIVVVVIVVLLLLRPQQVVGGDLTIESVVGLTEIPINVLQTLSGIDLDSLAPESKTIVERFYEKYKSDKGDSLLNVFFIEQILRFVDLGDADYSRMIFQSIDGARVVIEPRAGKDSLILMTLEKVNDKHSLRLVMPEDSFSQRWLKNIVRITLE